MLIRRAAKGFFPLEKIPLGEPIKLATDYSHTVGGRQECPFSQPIGLRVPFPQWHEDYNPLKNLEITLR